MARLSRDLIVSGSAAGIALAMLGVSFAAVPLYDWFCRTTGYGGTTQVASVAPTRKGVRNLQVRFDANVNGLPWRFNGETASTEVTVGETRTVYYSLTNTGPSETVGIASYNVTPEIAGAYFNKLQCFCFTEQTLAAGERREEAVVFFIDPAIEQDPELAKVHTITLSYTFFPVKTPVKPQAALATKPDATTLQP